MSSTKPRIILTAQNPGFISIVAMVETVWVLHRAYNLLASEIVAAMQRMLQSEVFVIENEQQVFTVMIAVNQGLGSFADALIAALGARAGCSRTLTFDREALRLDSFALP